MEDSKKFASYLRKISKPTLIVANKIDVKGADKNFERLRERYNDMIVIPASADSELTLRRAEQKELIKYLEKSKNKSKTNIFGIKCYNCNKRSLKLSKDSNKTPEILLS